VLGIMAGVLWGDGVGVEKLSSAMVHCLLVAYVGFLAAMGNPMDDSVLGFVCFIIFTNYHVCM